MENEPRNDWEVDVRELVEKARDLETEVAGWGSGESYLAALFTLADQLREALDRFTAKYPTYGEGEVEYRMPDGSRAVRVGDLNPRPHLGLKPDQD